MRSRNPCLFLLLRFEGWNVLFISVCVYLVSSEVKSAEAFEPQRYELFFCGVRRGATFLLAVCGGCPVVALYLGYEHYVLVLKVWVGE